jgi:hypothetical protein
VSLNPVAAAFQTMRYALTGRLHFSQQRVGDVFIDERGCRFRVFRYVEVTPSPDRPAQPGAVFIPRFHVKGMSPRVNQLFSWLPIPCFVGLPGFRSKRWMMAETTGEAAGYYEWDCVQDVENYARSFAGRFMTGRSVPGSIQFSIYSIESAPPPPAPDYAATITTEAYPPLVVIKR